MTTTLTQYGFQFGPALVERAIEHKGYVVVTIKTKRQMFDVMVTPSGLIRPREVCRNLTQDEGCR